MKKQLWQSTQGRKDPRIKKLAAKYGLPYYYVTYWMILCELFKNGPGRLKVKDDPTLVKVAKEWKIEKINSFIHDCIHEFNLFESDGDEFWSDLKDGKIYVYCEEYPES